MSSYDPPPPFNPAMIPPSNPPPNKNNKRGIIGGILVAGTWVLNKLSFLTFLFKFAIFKTLFSMVLFLGVYVVVYGIWVAVGLVAMLFLHEMGHVYEIRRQGMKATAPIFIPFFGAAIFQKEHATDAWHQGLIGIAGPIAGTLAAGVAWVLYEATHFEPFLLAAFLGALINLLNLIPAGMLDGGWILGAVSKWFQVVGIVALIAGVVLFHLWNPFLILIVIIAIPHIIDRFRNPDSPYYTKVTSRQRAYLFGGWLFLVVALGYASMATNSELSIISGHHMH